ncbi:MAG: hypothetical protein ACRDTH_24165 [Pseudonocardiaceae bacterium]
MGGADPQFPAKTPAGRESSTPASAPGGQPNPSPGPGASRGGRLRWPRGRDEEHLHLLAPGDVVTIATKGHPRTLYGRLLPAEGLSIHPRVPEDAVSQLPRPEHAP